jgi:phosphatidate cytidylyltransferase
MKRVLTALVLIPPVTYLVFWAPPLWLLAAAALVAILCFHEFVGLAEGYGVEIPWWLGYPAGYLILTAGQAPVPGLPALAPGDETLGFLLILIVAIFWAMRGGDVRRTLPDAGIFLAGALYVFGPWRYVGVIRLYDPHWLFFALSLNWLGDTAAYLAGRTLGRHKLAPAISPGKTWEGAIASAAVTVLFGILYLGYFLPEVPIWARITAALAANLASQAGDLAESAFKRGAGVKDSSGLLPGHGGMLDRVDGTLFSLPVVYLFLRLFH